MLLLMVMFMLLLMVMFTYVVDGDVYVVVVNDVLKVMLVVHQNVQLDSTCCHLKMSTVYPSNPDP